MFKKSKYIIVAQVEKAETQTADDWGGKISALKNSFTTCTAELKREFRQ